MLEQLLPASLIAFRSSAAHYSPQETEKGRLFSPSVRRFGGERIHLGALLVSDELQGARTAAATNRHPLSSLRVSRIQDRQRLEPTLQVPVDNERSSTALARHQAASLDFFVDRGATEAGYLHNGVDRVGSREVAGRGFACPRSFLRKGRVFAHCNHRIRYDGRHFAGQTVTVDPRYVCSKSAKGFNPSCSLSLDCLRPCFPNHERAWPWPLLVGPIDLQVRSFSNAP
jgi:hypothetical protein